MVIGSRRMKLPSVGKMLGDYAVGESVFLNMDGTAIEHLVVNQGIPGNSSLYDSSCDGAWLLPKNIVEERQYHNVNSVYYAATDIHAYLNGDYLTKYDAAIQSIIKQVKIPHITGSNGALTSGANGLRTKCFVLGNMEVGITAAPSNGIWEDGACLEYFAGTNGTDADAKRIAYLNGAAMKWALRSPHIANYYTWAIGTRGYAEYWALTYTFGIRPAIILPFETVFNPSTNQFKGVA